MKRYLLFAGQIYYPRGGWEDFVGFFDELIDAHRHLNATSGWSWFHIVDSSTHTIIEEGLKQ